MVVGAAESVGGCSTLSRSPARARARARARDPSFATRDPCPRGRPCGRSACGPGAGETGRGTPGARQNPAAAQPGRGTAGRSRRGDRSSAARHSAPDPPIAAAGEAPGGSGVIYDLDPPVAVAAGTRAADSALRADTIRQPCARRSRLAGCERPHRHNKRNRPRADPGAGAVRFRRVRSPPDPFVSLTLRLPPPVPRRRGRERGRECDTRTDLPDLDTARCVQLQRRALPRTLQRTVCVAWSESDPAWTVRVTSKLPVLW